MPLFENDFIASTFIPAAFRAYAAVSNILPDKIQSRGAWQVRRSDE